MENSGFQQSSSQLHHVNNSNNMSIRIRRLYCYLCSKYFNDSHSFGHHHSDKSHPSKIHKNVCDDSPNLIDTSIWYEIKEEPDPDDDDEMVQDDSSQVFTDDDATVTYSEFQQQQQPSKLGFILNQKEQQQSDGNCYPLKETGKEDEIKVQCLVCSKIFIDLNSLLSHIQRKRWEETTESTLNQRPPPNNNSIVVELNNNNNSTVALNPINSPSIILQLVQQPIFLTNDPMLTSPLLNPVLGPSEGGLFNNNREIVVNEPVVEEKNKHAAASAAAHNADQDDDNFDYIQDAQSSLSDDDNDDPDYKDEDNDPDYKGEHSYSLDPHLEDKHRGKKPVQIIRVQEHPIESKKFTCSCDETFTSRLALKEHALELDHDAPEAHRFYAKCPICPNSIIYTKKSLIVQHMESNHGDEKLHKCTMTNDCQKSFWKPAELKRHIFQMHKIQEIYECTECDQSFTHLLTFRKHMRCHRRKVEKVPHQKTPKKGAAAADWPCPHCPSTNVTQEGEEQEPEGPTDVSYVGLVFRTKKKLMDHCLHHHPGRRLYTCDFLDCDKSYWDKFTLRTHRLTWHERGDDSNYPFQCTFDPSICSKRFIHGYQLATHLRGHSGEFPFLCSTCGARFRDVRGYYRHLKYHEQRLECPTCHKIFNSKGNLNRHEKKQHLGLVEFHCSMCPLTFGQKSTLDSHMFTQHRIGEAKFVCEFCGKTFVVKSVYTAHRTTCRGRHCDDPNNVRRPKQTQFPCTFENCSKIFSNAVGLAVHMKRSHKSKPLTPTPCPDCGKVFLGDHRLRIHITRIHRKDMGSFQCNLCGKILSSSGSMRTHMRYHKNFPPGSLFKCHICAKEFNDQRFVTRHIRLSHQSE